MAVSKQSVTFFNFSGGLNTEATPLSREPNDAVDIQNIDLDVDGSISRRRGIDFIGAKTGGGVYSTSSLDYTTEYGVYADEVPSAIVFSPTRSDGTSFKVVVSHIGNTIQIFDYEKINDLTLLDTPRQTIDISDISETAQIHFRTQFAANANRLYILNKHLPLGYIEYIPESNGFGFVQQNLLVRNLEGSADADSRVNHNQKSYQAIRTHVAVEDTEPGVGENWEENWVHLGSEITGDPSWALTVGNSTKVSRIVDVGFTTIRRSYNCILNHTSDATNQPGVGASWQTFWEEIQFDESLSEWETGKTYIITLNADYVSNVVQLDNFGQIDALFTAGRLWLVGTINGVNKIYFSQTIKKDVNYNRMFQEADPLSDLDSENVDTDGGDIVITGAEQVLSLAPFQGGVVVFANNGVWYVRGTGGVFRATDFSVDKVSSDGIVGTEAWAAVDDKIVYFGTSNVYVIAAQDVDILPSTQDISIKVSSFYSSIPFYNKQSGKVIYNSAERKIYFFTNFQSFDWTVERNPNKQATHMRDALIFDIKLGAWYKYRLSEDTSGDKVFIGEAFITPGGSQEFATVVDNNNNLVEDGLGNLVEAFDTRFNDAEDLTTLILVKKNGNNADYAFGQLVGDEFSDFSLNSVDEESYSSFVETAHQVFNDVNHVKQTPYVTTIFKRVESGVIDESTGEDITPGGCLMTVHQGFSTSSKSAKYGTARQAYLPTRWSISYFDGSDPGIEIVKNKHRVRGRGDAYQLRFENDGDKDFKLYGFQVDTTVSNKV